MDGRRVAKTIIPRSYARPGCRRVGGAPFVALCGMTQSVAVLIVALSAWGFFKGLYDANIFASVFDVIRPEARGTAAGFMNTVGWLGGGGAAPLVIGIIATEHGLSVSIALAAVVYISAGLLLLCRGFWVFHGESPRGQRGVLAQGGDIFSLLRWG